MNTQDIHNKLFVEQVEIRYIGGGNTWIKVSRFLGMAMQGIEYREINTSTKK